MSIEHFATIADLLPEPMLLAASSGMILAANRGMLGCLGISRQEAIGRPFTDFCADPAESVLRYLRSCARTRALFLGSLVLKTAGQSKLECRAEGALFQPQTGSESPVVLLRLTPRENSIARFVALNQKLEETSREVARRRRAEEALFGQKQELLVTLTSIGDAVIVTDRQGRLTFLNPIAASLTGWAPEDALGKPLTEVFHIVNEQTRELAMNPVERVLREGVTVGLANHTLLIARDGTERPIDDSAAPIRHEDGYLTGLVLVFRDVTERRRTEEALVQADRQKNEFLAMLSHELRNPLAPIRSGLDVLTLEGARGETIELMKEQLDHLVRLVDDLLDISRIVRGRIELRKETVLLSTVLTRALELASPLIREYEHELLLSLPAAPLWVHADPVRLAQVIANLLTNAAKYTDPHGEIRLTAAQSEGAVEIRVVDNGIGITPELLPRVFDLFMQVDASLDRAQGGLGIGLTLVRSLVEQHGGTVAAFSAGRGQGSEFVVSLPVVPEADKDREEPETSTAAVNGRRILVVDDNQGAARLLALLLQKLGDHTVEIVHDGFAALEAAKAFRPHLILLDIGLPHLDGYEVARRLRALPEFQQTLVVALTGYGQPEDQERALEAGCDIHLTKPPGVDQLRTIFEHPRLADGRGAASPPTATG